MKTYVICINGFKHYDEDTNERLQRKPDQYLDQGRLYEVVSENKGHLPSFRVAGYDGIERAFPANLFVRANVVEVELLAFDRGEKLVRNVGIPADKPITLDAVFYYGQNDFQPDAKCYSVSVGDVIRWQNKKVVVCGLGFAEMSEAQYEDYLKVDSHGRTFHVMKNEKSYSKVD